MVHLCNHMNQTKPSVRAKALKGCRLHLTACPSREHAVGSICNHIKPNQTKCQQRAGLRRGKQNNALLRYMVGYKECITRNATRGGPGRQGVCWHAGMSKRAKSGRGVGVSMWNGRRSLQGAQRVKGTLPIGVAYGTGAAGAIRRKGEPHRSSRSIVTQSHYLIPNRACRNWCSRTTRISLDPNEQLCVQSPCTDACA